MAYSDFTLARVKEELGLTVLEGKSLFDSVVPIAPSMFLQEGLKRSRRFVTLVNTEKMRSEFLIAPILGEVLEAVQPQGSLFSGTDFNVDPARGLQGFCDFILSQSPEQIDVEAPVVTIVEAKNESIKAGLGQCLAEMVAAQIFNERKGKPIARIYGAVTTGDLWRFLVLEGTVAQVDGVDYFIGEVEKILGILMLPFRDGPIDEPSPDQTPRSES
jgi:hypothetical protein